MEHAMIGLGKMGLNMAMRLGRDDPHGAGHFVKMVHNGIEYGMMQSFAEGFSIVKSKKDFGLDLAQILPIWQDGSVVRS